jgi:sporulation protein YlmC with PRC-barrel domain
MLESYSMEELKTLDGHEVVDVKGESLGYVDLVFYDDPTGRPEWIGIWSGVAGKGHRVLVPIRGIEHVEDEIRVPWTKDIVMGAPTYSDEDGRGLFLDDLDVIGISADKERAAYEHYGVEPLTARPEGTAGPRFRAVVVEVRTIRQRG